MPRAKFHYDPLMDCVRADGCNMVVWAEDVSCTACYNFPSENNLFERAERRADDRTLAASRIPLSYLTDYQRDERHALIYARYQRVRLALLGQDRKLKTAMQKLDDYKRLLGLIATDKLARVRAFFASQVRRGSSPRSMIDLWKKVVAGLYKPKQFDEAEIDETVLAWRLGVTSLVYAQNHSTSAGGASLTTARRCGKLTRFHSCVEDVTIEPIRLNFEKLFEKPRVGQRCLWHLKMDDVKGNKMLRVDEVDGICRGVCYHAKGAVDLRIKTFADIEAIRDALDSKKVHYGTELTVVAIAPNRETDYAPHVVALSAGCLVGDPPERTRKLPDCVLTTYTNDPRGQEALGILATVQPDGAGLFVKICHAVFFSKRMGPDHPLFDYFSDCALWPLWTGEGIYERCTSGCELKHTIKRFVERIKSETGMTLVENSLRGTNLRRLLRSSGVSSEREIDDMFAMGCFDAMRVPPKIMLVRAVARLGLLTADDFDDEGRLLFLAFPSDLKLLGRFCGVYATLVADKRPTLPENMINVSTLQHLAVSRKNVF